MSAISLLMDSVSVISPGGERLQVELAGALDRTCPHDADAVVLRRPDQAEIGGFSRIRAECVAAPVETRLQRWKWLRSGLPFWANRLGATAVFVGGGGVSARLRRMCGVIATTNNMVPFSSEQVRHYPPFSPARLRLIATRALMVRGLRKADAVVLHSQHALRTVSEFTGDLFSKTTVVLTGVPREARLDAGAPPPDHPYGGRPYFLYFSTIRWYKNHVGLVEAYRRLSERIDDLPELILAGICKDEEYLAAIQDAISGASLDGRVRYVGPLPRDELPSWLHHATVNVFPSLCETNSVIQAEILGLRGVMATSRSPPMSEVAGAAAELFDPHDADDIARVLEALWRCRQRRDELRRLAGHRAGELSWDDCGKAIWHAARRVTEQRRARAA